MVMSAVIRDDLCAQRRLGEILVREGSISQPDLFSALEMSCRQGKRLDHFLVDEGLVASADVTAVSRRLLTSFLIRHNFFSEDEFLFALAVSKAQGKRLNKVLIEERLISPYALATAISCHFNIPFIDLSRYVVQLEARRSIPEALVFQHDVLPLSLESERLTIAMAEPYDLELLEELRPYVDRSIAPFVAMETEIEEAIGHVYAGIPLEDHEPRALENLLAIY